MATQLNTSLDKKPSFKQQMLIARQEAIIDVVNRLLSEKGFDAMTVDEVAFEVGVAKASLYKHFPSKEDLATAAMVRVTQRALTELGKLDPSLSAIEKLKLSARWMMQQKMLGAMPTLPSTNSALRTNLLANKDYIDALMKSSDLLGSWIEEAQDLGQISKDIPALAVLYTLYARACDPVLEFLKASALYSDEQILKMVEQTCFDGLKAR